MKQEVQLVDLWRSCARRATDSQLASIVVASVACLLAFGVVIAFNAHWTLRWWPLALAPLLAGAFGAWAIADRELAGASPRRTRAFASLKLAAALVASLATAAGIVAFLKLAVGTWIS